MKIRGPNREKLEQLVKMSGDTELLVFERIAQLVDHRDWGHSQQGYPQHANTIASLDKNPELEFGRRRFPKMLSQDRLCDHFIHRDTPTNIHYVNAGYEYQNRRLLLICFDVDHKNTYLINDCHQVRDAIEQLLDVKFYSCRSSGGNGLHCFLLVNVCKFVRYCDIKLKLDSLSDIVRNHLRCFDFVSRFDKVCGTITDYQNLTLGNMCRIPVFNNAIEYKSLLDCLNYDKSTNLDYLISKASCVDNTSILSPIPYRGDAIKGENISRTAKTSDNGIFSLPYPIGEIEDNTLTRRRLFAYGMAKELNRVPTVNELMIAYQAKYGDGPKDKRKSQFKGIVKYLNQHYKPDCGDEWQPAFEKSKKIVEQRISQQDCDKEYGKKSNGSRLMVEDVAIVYALYLTGRKDDAGNVAMATPCVEKRTMALRNANKISKTIDGKKFCASKEILENFGLICETEKFVKGKCATKYVVVDVAEASAEPFKDHIEHSEAKVVGEEAQTSYKGNDYATSIQIQRQQIKTS